MSQARQQNGVLPKCAKGPRDVQNAARCRNERHRYLEFFIRETIKTSDDGRAGGLLDCRIRFVCKVTGRDKIHLIKLIFDVSFTCRFN